jgi:hypothetical protein
VTSGSTGVSSFVFRSPHFSRSGCSISCTTGTTSCGRS